ncbi:hypothetical protein AMS68_002084 [Peltaster fructicola]|uniref:T6SS Phospholipase effector Tle1-like catalytic domain-containing protein n=1 Tax=Peltaster fructicola TaxID=286661 RepID=A0A6H0XP82_9PEZI|nr:hypothetical protein AMS68_002084 [Peltaster fructicola]
MAQATADANVGPSADSLPVSANVKVPKKLIVCCDGTWQDSDNTPQRPTNITRICRAISGTDDSHHQQIVYYQAGIGTGIGLTNHIINGATGRGLAEHIREAYVFLASNYAEHDDLVLRDSIFLGGYSRGAYTARSIGGLLGAVGLLKKTAMQYFYDIFLDWEHAGEKHYKPRFFNAYFSDEAERKKYKPNDALAHVEGAENIDKYMDEYRRQLVLLGLSQEVKIKSIGVFETVGALGIPVNPVLQRILPFLPSFFREYSWFDTRLGSHVESGFQALALDEKRAPFHPAVWEKPDMDNSVILEQVWFPGSHANVGGGGHAGTGISDLTICWMMDHLAGHTLPPEKEFNSLDWIKFDDAYIEKFYSQRVEAYNKMVADGKATSPFRGWSLGLIYNSFQFPQNLIGKRVRTPGQYHFTSYITGREDPNKPLRNTNEFVHASVRARIHLGGRAPEPDWNTAFPWGFNILPRISQAYYWITGALGGRFWPKYNPQARGQPLQNWRLLDEHVDHKQTQADASTVDDTGRIYWQYIGKKKNPEHRELPEARLGKYELLLLSKDKNWDAIVVDDDGWVKKIWKRALHDLRRASTA